MSSGLELSHSRLAWRAQQQSMCLPLAMQLCAYFHLSSSWEHMSFSKEEEATHSWLWPFSAFPGSLYLWLSCISAVACLSFPGFHHHRTPWAMAAIFINHRVPEFVTFWWDKDLIGVSLAFGDSFLHPTKAGPLVSLISWALYTFEVIIFKFMWWVTRIVNISQLIKAFKLWNINEPKNNWAVVVTMC